MRCFWVCFFLFLITSSGWAKKYHSSNEPYDSYNQAYQYHRTGEDIPQGQLELYGLAHFLNEGPTITIPSTKRSKLVPKFYFTTELIAEPFNTITNSIELWPEFLSISFEKLALLYPFHYFF